MGVEIILPARERDEQGEADDRRYRQIREDYLADRSFRVMSKMLSLWAYGKSIALSHNNAGAMSFSLARQTLHYREKIFNQPLFVQVDVISAAEDILWAELMWTLRSDPFGIPLGKLSDDVTFTKRGVSFVTHEQNGLSNKKWWMLERAHAHREGRKLLRGDTLVATPVKQYLRRVDRFRELLFFCVHVTGGQLARGTEITSLRFRNSFMQDRNVFVMHGHMVIVTRYRKSQSQFDRPKVIPRFLSCRVGQLLAVYLSCVQPLQVFIGGKVCGFERSDYIWASEFGPWETDRLTNILAREMKRGLGWRTTTLDFHVAIVLGRGVIGDHITQGYAERTDEVEETEADDDGLEVSAGRSGEIGAQRYRVSLEIIKHLSSKSIDLFRQLSMHWHRFLDLVSCTPAYAESCEIELTHPRETPVPPAEQKRKWSQRSKEVE
ncbi:hypothetical protein KC352_g4971 [Hortaea werneckii]|nr:hypothetical protein KC352_g4971 [Hortaea werneckii]